MTPCLKFQLTYSAQFLVADAELQRVLNVSIQLIRLTFAKLCLEIASLVTSKTFLSNFLFEIAKSKDCFLNVLATSRVLAPPEQKLT